MIAADSQPHSLRSLFNTFPILGAVVAIVGIAAVVISWRHSAPAPAGAPTVYFTDDDGATFFSAADSQIVPFDHNGKMAVRAHVFKDADGKQFVGWMEEYKPEAKSVLAKIAAERVSNAPFTVSPQERQVIANGMEYKKRGDSKWTAEPAGNTSLFSASLSKSIRAPNGSSAQEVVQNF